MKLGEEVTCTSLAGVFLRGHVPVQSVCLEALGQSWSRVGQGHAFPRVYWQLAVWWEVEREARSRAKCEQRLLCSLGVPTLLDHVSPKVLEQNSDGWVQTHSIPYKCALPHPDVCVYVPVCVAVCVCVCVYSCVCSCVVCVHWVLETAGKNLLLVDLFLVMTSSLVCLSCS